MKQRGGNISNYQTDSSFGTEQLRSIHIDKRVLPILNDEVSKNVSIANKYFESIPCQTSSLNSLIDTNANTNFIVNANSDSLISLSESYFISNMTIARHADVGGEAANDNFALLPFASHLFFDNLITKISNVDVSDSHTQGLYAVSAFYKQLLTKSSEVPAYGIIPTSLTAMSAYGGTNNTYIEYPKMVNDTSADSTIESIGLSNDSCDGCIVNPGIGFKTTDAAGNFDGKNCIVFNHNAVYYKNLVQGYDTSVGIPNTSGTVEFVIYPTDGMWRCANYLPSNLQLQIQTTIAQRYKWFANSFPYSDNLPTITINNFNLMLCRVKPTIDTIDAINKVLLEKAFTYNILNSQTQLIPIAKQTGASTLSIPSVLSGILPNVVLISFVSKGAFDKNPPTGAAANSNTWLDCHTLSSGSYRKVNDDFQPWNWSAGTDLGIPKISSIYIDTGSKRVPSNQQGYTNFNVGREQLVYLKQSYQAYKDQCIDSDRPWLSYEHWIGQFTVFAFNLTNEDNALMSSTDETQYGSLNIQISFADKTIDQYMLVTGLYYSEVSINASRNVTKLGF